MDLHLNDKVIIVTGGAKGIGEGIVKVLAGEGAIPVIVGRNEEDNRRLMNEIHTDGKQTFQVVAELTHPDECKRAVDAVIKEFNRIDGVVNNAGVNDSVGLERGSYEKFMESVHKNLVHYYLMTQSALGLPDCAAGICGCGWGASS